MTLQLLSLSIGAGIAAILVAMVCLFKPEKHDDGIPPYDEKQGQRDIDEALATASQWQSEPFENLQ